jgi:hypothetical protein
LSPKDRKIGCEWHAPGTAGGGHRGSGLEAGSYIDPQAGRISLRRYASEWLAGQTFDESTCEATESRLRVHIYPYLGDRGLGSIRPSHVQAWDRALQQQGLAPTYRRVLFANLSASSRQPSMMSGRTYTHLLPTSEQRTRQAVDRALTGGAATADGLPTAQEPH